MGYFAEQKSIRDLFSNQLYQIPRNQRKYVWNEYNWGDLFSDISYSTQGSHNHFIGSIVLLKEKEREWVEGLPKFTIVDGQQRIITLTILLSSILFLMKKNNLADDYYGSEKYVFARDNKNEVHCIFSSSYHEGLDKLLNRIRNIPFGDVPAISNLINTTITNKVRDKQIADAFQFFYTKIEESSLDKGIEEYLTSLRDSIINIKYVRIEATTEEDSYTIFEILNARGQLLSDHELLKNYVMRYTIPKSAIDDVRKEWESMESQLGNGINRYLLHYLIHKFNIDDNDRKDTYKAIKKYVRPSNISSFFTDFMLKASYYSKIYNPVLKDVNGNQICSKVEYDIFRFFKSKRQEQFRPILLSLIHQKEINNLSNTDYEKALIFLEKFFICYILIGREKSNTITAVVANFANRIENEFSPSTMSDFYNSFSKRIPNSDWFINAFSGIGYSHHDDFYKDEKEKNKVKLILELYEKSLSGLSEISEYTIEHIIPDSQGKNSPNIGNLLPLEKKLNEKCHDLPLSDKIQFYNQSSFLSVRRFVQRYGSRLEEFNIEKRMKHLALFFFSEINKNK